MSKLGNKNYSHISQIALDIVYCWQSFAVEKLFELTDFYHPENGLDLRTIDIGYSSKNYYSIRFFREKEEFIVNILEKENYFEDYSARNIILNCNLKDLHKNLNEINYINFLELANNFNEKINSINKEKVDYLNMLNDLKNFNKNERYVNELLIELKK
jgi:hypothetical protein